MLQEIRGRPTLTNAQPLTLEAFDQCVSLLYAIHLRMLGADDVAVWQAISVGTLYVRTMYSGPVSSGR